LQVTTEHIAMIEEELESHWEAELATATSNAYEGRRLLSVAPVEAYAGADQAGSRRFVAVRLDADRRKSLAARFPRSSKGILVESVEQGGGRITFFLREQAGVPGAVFPAVMLDVLEAGEGASVETATRAALERFSSWQAALSRQAGGMTAPEARGIIGELVVARDLVQPQLGTSGLVEAWRSPEDDHIHDFVGATWELEVKTAIAPGTYFHVSAEGQLEPAPDNRMFLAAVELEPAGEGTSLNGLVHQLLSGPELTAEVTEALHNAMIRRGALLKTEGGEAAQQYRVVSVDLFEVRNGFPLLPRRSLPGGVSALHYAVSLSACLQYKVDHGVLSDVLMNRGNGQ
jgi:hypothetical protein